MIVDLKGNKRTLTPEWIGEQGLAWSSRAIKISANFSPRFCIFIPAKLSSGDTHNEIQKAKTTL